MPKKPMLISYGSSDFAVVSKSFYVDKTQFISKLETTRIYSFVFFRPRRFGKSLFLSTLQYFYDIYYIDDFHELFKGLSIYTDPDLQTYKRNQFLTMFWSFSELDTSKGIDEFNLSLAQIVNGAIRHLTERYAYLVRLLPNINDNPVESFRSLCLSLTNSQYSLYLFIDEYDTSINQIIKSGNQALLKELKDNNLSWFYLLFTTIKTSLLHTNLGRVFMVGVMPLALNNFTSGFNVATDLTFEDEFASLCGFTHKDLENHLKHFANENNPIESLLDYCTKEYDGYSFGSLRLYNSTLCLHYFKSLSSLKRVKYDDDKNVYPSNSSLSFISTHPLLPSILSTLLSTREISCKRETNQRNPVEESLNVELLIDANNLDLRYLLSFLYFTGSLTLDYEASDDTTTKFRIPNEITFRHFLFDTSTIYKLNATSSNRQILDNAIVEMFNGNIEPFAFFISSNMLSLLRHNDVIHSQECDLKAMFILSVVISLQNKFIKCAQSEHDIEGTQVDAYFQHPDPSSVKYPIVHIEFKNTTVGQIQGWYKKYDWKFMNEQSCKVFQLEETELLKLTLQFPIEQGASGNYLKKRVTTVNDMWENTKAQATLNSKKMKEPHISYAVYRIGLQRLLCSKCDSTL